ncbi:MAG TPA: hypothetical protein VGE74_22775 [Gemmata sp.]
MDPLTDALVEADGAATEAAEALERLRDALQRCYDAAGARRLPLAHDLGPLVTRVERMGPEVGGVKRLIGPHAELARAEGCPG